MLAEIGDGPSQPARCVARADDVVAELKQQRPPAARRRSSRCRPPGWPSVGASWTTPRERIRQGPRHRGLPRRDPAAVARGALGAGGRRGVTSGTRATTSAPAWPTCTPGSRRSAASTCRARWSATVAPWRCRGCGWRWTTGSPELAYEWSERARALVARVTPVRPPADEQLAAELTELRVLYAADPSPHSADGRRLDQLRDHIREQSWYGDGGGRVGEPAALEEVQAELAATDACLVAHVVGRRLDHRRRGHRHRGPHRAAVRGRAGRRRTSTGSRPTSTWPPRSWPGRSPPRSAARSTSGSGSSPTASSLPCCRWSATVASC